MNVDQIITNAISEIRRQMEADHELIQQQQSVIADLRQELQVKADNTYLLQMADVIGQMKPLLKTQESKLMGWVAELVRLHDLWEKEGER